MSIRSVARCALALGAVAAGVPLVLGTVTEGIARVVVFARRVRGTGWELPATAELAEPMPTGSRRTSEADDRKLVSVMGEPAHR